MGGWRQARLRSLLPRRWRSAAGFAAARCAPAAPPLVVLAVFAAVGVAVLDDYGVSVDETNSRGVGRWLREAGGWRREAATIDLSAARQVEERGGTGPGWR